MCNDGRPKVNEGFIDRTPHGENFFYCEVVYQERRAFGALASRIDDSKPRELSHNVRCISPREIGVVASGLA
jgi:hypothetical protein